VLGEYPNLLFNWMRLKCFLTGEKRVALEGIVKLDGEPLPRGTIIFHPLDKVGAAAVVGYVFNTGKVRGEYKVAANVGAAPGKYRIEVRQDAVQWLSNANNPMIAKFKLLKNGTDAQKKEVADYARSRNLEPTIENQRVYRKIHPNDATEIFAEVKAEGHNRLDIEVFSKREQPVAARKLLGNYQEEGINMSYTMADYRRYKATEFFKNVTREEVLEAFQNLTSEERRELPKKMIPELRDVLLQGLSPEERLAGLSSEQIAKYLKELRSKRPARKGKPRRRS
jgi:hypothetical protein